MMQVAVKPLSSEYKSARSETQHAGGAGSHVVSREFPGKPVRAVVPFNAGGSLDVLARSMAPAFRRALGQNVIVDNRSGAGTVIGSEVVAHGYTLLYIANSFIINPAVRGKLKQIGDSLDKEGMFPALLNAEQFDAFIRAELPRNEKIARVANMRAE